MYEERIEYDPRKAQINWQKHGVSFADAELVFFDLAKLLAFGNPFAIHELDPDAVEEERFIALGMSNAGVLLVVVYTMRGEVFRVISARRATRQEAKAYEG
ncbi:MAG: hypothetical protein GVY04_21810 [Cyanobacteria bacterium]|jgi:uncharacterized DUF497 family protein|nr:hypothetical protein [Cyanobacteria bacterium GSL.Bin1]